MVTIVQPQITGFQPRSEGNDLYYGTELGILDAFIDGGLGNDAFIGNSSGTDSNGIADSFLSGSEGADLIIGNAVGVGSVGIFDSNIDLGADDDRLLARGDQLGIFDLNLDAGPGNDYIDIRSGDGNLSGNTGIDTLVLEGEFAEYEITPLDSADADVTFSIQGITENTAGTNLLVDQFEVFVYSDVTLTYNIGSTA